MLIPGRHRGPRALAARLTRPSPALRALRWFLAAAAIAAVVGYLAAPAAALTFNLTEVTPMDPTARAAFQAAADAWSRVIVSPITVNIDIDYRSMGGNYLALTSTEQNVMNYSSFRSALKKKATSLDDAQALSSLPAAMWFPMMINRTANNPNGPGSAAPYLDPGDEDSQDNNWMVQVSRADQKALGLLGPADSFADGHIKFNSDFKWSYSPPDGIASDSYDFVGAAIHEIGHVLGFLSNTEMLDGKTDDTYYTWVTPLDLFRYSDLSYRTAGGVIDWTNDDRAKYFSLDKGATPLGEFSTGITYGDEFGAGHWKVQGSPLGIMDPTLAKGELGAISGLDLRAMDVIGYKVVPEPGTLTGLLAGACLLRRRRARVEILPARP
ncbi:MAG: NF038122 family metalloprotease [Planctomycetota bacterium]|nr:NF038122 family metalloprotease [Planctomycetota bacterium]